MRDNAFGVCATLAVFGILWWAIYVLVQDSHDAEQRLDRTCVSAFRSARSGHDSLMIASVSSRCAAMIGDSVKP